MIKLETHKCSNNVGQTVKCDPLWKKHLRYFKDLDSIDRLFVVYIKRKNMLINTVIIKSQNSIILFKKCNGALRLITLRVL